MLFTQQHKIKKEIQMSVTQQHKIKQEIQMLVTQQHKIKKEIQMLITQQHKLKKQTNQNFSHPITHIQERNKYMNILLLCLERKPLEDIILSYFLLLLSNS